jgi:hypothetical protein
MAVAADASAPRATVIEHWDNTYQMAPDEKQRFDREKVEGVLRAMLEGRLKDAAWSDETCRRLTTEITAEARDKASRAPCVRSRAYQRVRQCLLTMSHAQVKALNIPRYKLVVQAVVGEVKDQGVFVASRCMWDTEKDNCASFTVHNEAMYCTVMVFGLYWE